MFDPSLREIVQAFQTGSREAFAKLVGRYQNLVTSVAFANTGDLQRSEDIAQQAFLVAWQKQHELSDPDQFGGWIRGIANNLARNDRRLKANLHRDSNLSISRQSEPAIDDTPERLSSQREQSEVLWATLDKIPLDYREPLILFYREDHSVAAVAEQMGLSEDAVKQRLKRGRAMVKREIETMVEQFLIETRPSEAFSASVMASLPAIGSTLGSVTAKAGAAIGTKAAAGKLTAGLSAGAIGGGLGVLGGLIGLLGGIGGAWWGTKQGMKHSTSEQERQLHKSMFAQSVWLSILFTVGILAAVFLLKGPLATIAMVVLQVVFISALGLIIFRFTQNQRALHQAFGKPEYMKLRLSHGLGKPVSTKAFTWNAILMTVGVWTWLIIMTIIFQSFVMMSISIVVMSLQLLWVSIEAPKRREVLEQIRFNASICLAIGIIQFAIVIGGYLLGARNFDKSYDGVPLWVGGWLVLAIGGGIAAALFARAYLLERQAERK